MNILLKKYRYHLLILLIGLVWLLTFNFLTQMSAQGVMHSDSYNYQEAAKNLYLYCRGHVYRPILMAIINGIPYIFGASDESIFTFGFYVNVFCWLGISLLLFEILKEFVLPKSAFFFTVLSLFIVGNTAHVFHLLTETIYMFFIVLAFYFWLKYHKEQEWIWLSLSLSVFVLSMLIKPGSKFLALVFVLYFIRIVIKHYKDKASWFLYGSFFLVMVQCAGMKYQFGNFTISYVDSAAYYAYIGSKSMCIKVGKEYTQMNNPRADYIFSCEPSQQRKIATEDLKNQLQFNSLNLVKAYVSDVVENTKSGNSCTEECKNLKGVNKEFFDLSKMMLFDLSKWQNRFFTLLGFSLALFYFLKSFRKPTFITGISFFVLYIIVLSGISCGQGDRFHLVTFPFALVLLAKFLSDKSWIKPSSELLQK